MLSSLETVCNILNTVWTMSQAGTALGFFSVPGIKDSYTKNGGAEKIMSKYVLEYQLKCWGGVSLGQHRFLIGLWSPLALV